jgi:glycosyltransferase involved in cell wall biosynthesis
VGPQGFGLRLWRTQVEWLARRTEPRALVLCGTGPEAGIGLELHETRGIPFVLHLDAPEIAALRSAMEAGDPLARDLVERCSAIVVPTRSAWLEAYKLHTRPHDLEEIPVAVDLSRFRPGPADAGLRGRLQAGRGPVLLAVHDGDPAADVDTILQAFAALRGQHRRAVLVAAGFRDPGTRSLAKQLKVDRGVRFLEPSAGDLPELYRAADLFLTAHVAGRGAPVQGGGTALAEALASGLPVVGTKTPASADLVEEEQCGVLVEPGAHAKLGKVAADLLGADERRRELAAAARERAESRHDAAECARRLHTLLEVLLVRRLRREPAPAGAQLPAA